MLIANIDEAQAFNKSERVFRTAETTSGYQTQLNIEMRGVRGVASMCVNASVYFAHTGTRF